MSSSRGLLTGVRVEGVLEDIKGFVRSWFVQTRCSAPSSKTQASPKLQIASDRLKKAEQNLVLSNQCSPLLDHKMDSSSN